AFSAGRVARPFPFRSFLPQISPFTFFRASGSGLCLLDALARVLRSGHPQPIGSAGIVSRFKAPFCAINLADYHLVAAFFVHLPARDLQLVAFRERPGQGVDEPFWSDAKLKGFFIRLDGDKHPGSFAGATEAPLLDVVHHAANLDARRLIVFDLGRSRRRSALRPGQTGRPENTSRQDTVPFHLVPPLTRRPSIRADLSGSISPKRPHGRARCHEKRTGGSARPVALEPIHVSILSGGGFPRVSGGPVEDRCCARWDGRGRPESKDLVFAVAVLFCI